MSGYHLIVEADDDRDDGMASEVGAILAQAYPGHPWHVRIGQGMLIIKHMRMSAKWGIARRYSRFTWDAAVRKREIVLAAGELLERAGLTRGQIVEGEYKRVVEGVPQKDLALA